MRGQDYNGKLLNESLIYELSGDKVRNRNRVRVGVKVKDRSKTGRGKYNIYSVCTYDAPKILTLL